MSLGCDQLSCFLEVEPELSRALAALLETDVDLAAEGRSLDRVAAAECLVSEADQRQKIVVVSHVV